MPAPTKTKILENQIFENKRRLKDAEDSQVISSWMKAWTTSAPHPEGHLNSEASSRSQEGFGVTTAASGQDDDLDADFSADSDTGGLGFVKLQDNSSTAVLLLDRQNLSNNDKLRKQLLGRNVRQSGHSSKNINLTRADHGHSISSPKPNAAVARGSLVKRDDSDEEEREKKGGTRPRATHRFASKNVRSGTASRTSPATEEPTLTISKSAHPSKRRATSYLDEMLAKRSKKRVRKSDDDMD